MQTKIAQLGFGVSASIVNDGSGASPYRLSLTSFNTGRAGRVVLDAGATSLGTRNLVEGQDAAVFLGGAGSSQPLLVTSSQNSLTNVIPGVTVQLQGTSTSPVTLALSRSADNAASQLKKFTDGFNGIVGQISTLTAFDSTTNQGALLLGDATIESVQSQIYNSINSVVSGAGRYRTFADIGVTVTNGAKLKFDEAKFRSAFSADPEAVKNLFSQTVPGLAGTTALSKLNSGRGVSVSGGADFKVTTRDGSAFNVTIPPVGTVDDVIAAINAAANGKVTASIANNSLKIVDNSTGGSGQFNVGILNGSSAASDLGISGNGFGGILLGKPIFNTTNVSGGGLGYLIDQSLTALVDPVNGLIPQENTTLTNQANDFQAQMDRLDAIIKQKKDLLTTQFANMESVLAGLQSQQQALGSLTTVSATSTSKA